MSLISRVFRAPVNFVENKVDKVTGQLRAEIADGLASVSVILVLGGVVVFTLLFLSIALAIGLNNWIGLPYIGFVIVGVIYLIMALYIISLRKRAEFIHKVQHYFRVILKVPKEFMDKVPRENIDEDDFPVENNL